MYCIELVIKIKSNVYRCFFLSNVSLFLNKFPTRLLHKSHVIFSPYLGKNLVHKLGVTLEELYNGSTRKLGLQRNVICEKCEGMLRINVPGLPIRSTFNVRCFIVVPKY